MSKGTSNMDSVKEKDENATARMRNPQIYVERTLAIIKPDAMNKSDEIEDLILRNGFSILQVRLIISVF